MKSKKLQDHLHNEQQKKIFFYKLSQSLNLKIITEQIMSEKSLFSQVI